MGIFDSIQQQLQGWGYGQQQGQFGHTGSWGTPEAGISEFLQGKLVSPAYAAEPAGGQVLSSQLNYSPAPSDWGTSTGGGTGGGQPMATQPSGGQPTSPGRDLDAEARAAIEGGYNAYFNQLDAILNEGLPAQRSAQEGIVGSQYEQGMGQLGSQRTEGLGLLGKERTRTMEGQARNLKDISSNLRNAFMAGNVFLGARGAGDSSAANQYSYALTKLGSRQRGDVMRQTRDIVSEIGDREAKLQNIYTDESNRLASEKQQKELGIAQWFAEAQNQLRQARASGELGRGQDLANLSRDMLNYALNQLAVVQQEATNRRTALDQWALNNSKSIAQVKANLQQVSAFSPTLPQAGPIVGTPTVDASGGFNVPSKYFAGAPSTEERLDIFGNRIA